MLYLPAIDLMGGRAVRLRRGDPNAKTVYPDDPVSFAKRWEAAGGDWLHLVDLDAAFSGTPANLASAAAICAAVGIPCELGGGLRDADSVQRAFDAGVSRVVLGTRAAENLGFLREMSERHGPQKIAVGIDARDGFVAIKGWTEATSLRATDFAKEVCAAGAGAVIYTDIATDGMLQGPNLTALSEMAEAVALPVIASGGVSSRGDLEAIEALGCIHGAIIGKALYDGLIVGPLRRKSE